MEYVRTAQQSSRTESISIEDLLATLTRFSAVTIAESIRGLTANKKFVIYLSGGGAHNPLLVQWLRELLNTEDLKSTDELGVPGDAKEATEKSRELLEAVQRFAKTR